MGIAERECTNHVLVERPICRLMKESLIGQIALSYAALLLDLICAISVNN